MTDAPENITLKPNHLFGNPWSNAYVGDDDPMEDGEDTSYGYTRTDVTDARIDVIDWRKMFLAVHDRMQKSGESKEMGARWFSEAARAALKGEKA